MAKPFRVTLTADFYGPEGKPKYADLGLDVFADQPQVTVDQLAEHRKEIGPDQLAGCNGVIVLTPAVTRQSVASAENLLAVGRFGVGYDAVDVAACTDADVLLFITAGAVDRPVAEAVVGWMIGLTHHVLVKDRLVREGKWDDRSRYMGGELRNRTFGAVGLGGIARETIRLLSIFGMNPPIAYDPYVKPDVADSLGVRLVSLEELLRTADFVSLHVPLLEQTRGLIGARELALMKPTAYLINAARGGIVDEAALYDALAARRIAGAALDCFANEPVTTRIPFADLENVLLAPHSIAWTNELFRDIGRMAARGMVDLSLGRVPRGVVNADVLKRPSFQQKWKRLIS